MNISVCDGDYCWLCFTPDSCRNCESSSFSWSKPASQTGSFCTSDGREKTTNFDMDEPGDYFIGGPFKNPDLEVDDMIQCRGRGSQQLYAASTPKNIDYAEKWESPDTMPPPESSSPVCLDTDSSPSLTDLTRMLGREGPAVDRLLLCCPRDDGQSRVKASFNDRAYSNAPIFPTTMSIGCLPPLPTDMSESCSSILSCNAAQGPLDECLCAINRPQVVAVGRDICVVTARTAVQQVSDLGKPGENDRVSAPGSLIPAFCKGALPSGPTIFDLGVSTELEPPSLRGAENDRLNDAVSPKMPPRRVSTISVSFPAQATLGDHLKRRRSSVDYLPEPKKVKLDRTVSHVSSANDSSVQSKYQATEPASIRRAQSLKSALSTCSDKSTVRSFLCIQEDIHQCAYMRPFLQGFVFLPFIPELTDFSTLPGQGFSTDGSKHPAPQFRGLCSIKGEPSGSNARSLSPQILGHPRDSPSSHHRTTSTYCTHGCLLR